MSTSAPADYKRLAVGIGQLVVSGNKDEVLVAYGLGSCVGLTAYDPSTGVAGMAHVLLPGSSGRQPDPKEPARFADSAVVALFAAMSSAGSRANGLIVKLAGGASVLGQANSATFKIGERNADALKEQLKQRGITVAACDLGGTRGRTLELHPGTGKTFVRLAASAAVEF